MNTVLCLASYFKGGAFLTACKELGCHVILVTKEKLADEPWPEDAIDERFLMPDVTQRPDVFYAVSYLARTRKIDVIVPLDDFDVETAAALREHLRVPGMGDTTARYFRDKLAMRVQAEEQGILVPRFSPVINHAEIHSFTKDVPPPWVLKPRSQAGSMGIKKIHSDIELWQKLDELGDQQSFFVLEEFIEGDIFHVDAIVSEHETVFSEVHRYVQPLLAVSHEGGVFASRTIPRQSSEARSLREKTRELMSVLGMVRGVTHSEFILGRKDGQFYFLETAARVGGANIAELVQYATGVNLWHEWAKIELSYTRKEKYLPPRSENLYAGILICLARQEQPDLSSYDDIEIVWRMDKRNHAGLIIASESQGRIEELLESYVPRFTTDFLTWAPPLEEAPR